MVTQNQVECDFIFIEIPKLRKVHGENTSVFIEDWENYLKELSSDITDMIRDASPEEKQLLHRKIAALATKIE